MTSNIAGLVFAFSPLMILLFAAEMCTVETLYNTRKLTGDTVGKALAYVVLKLPCSMIIPVLLGLLGAAVIFILDATSVAYIVRNNMKEAR